MTAIYSHLGYVTLIPLLPLFAFALMLGITYENKRTSAWIGIGGTLGAWLISLALLLAELTHGGYHEAPHALVTIGSFILQVGVIADPLAAMMVVVVTSVSALVQIYSLEYMRGEEGFVRFFAFISLFTFSMLALVLSPSFFQTYVGWELVGVCSYLLIGHYWKRPAAAAAAKKAFIVTRLGDFPFLVGIGYVWFRFNDLNFHNLAGQWASGKVSHTGLFILAMLIFSGAVGKSAQFPLHVWLPDAMEGPTPISALIHAATMVAAGVYLVARVYPLFAASSSALAVVAVIGALTSLMAAIWAVAQDDIKRVIAYSTLSHLGLMMFALGVGAYTAAIFHLFVHAWFKALLFLGAGSVIHAVHSQNIWEMGGLRKRMPVTFWTFLIASLAAAGVPPLSGFWSKDGIIGGVFEHGDPVLDVVALLIAFFSSLYTFRLLFVVFYGEIAKRRAFEPRRIHESRTAMALPLAILAVPAAIIGFANLPGATHAFGRFLFFNTFKPEQVDAVSLSLSLLFTAAGFVVAALFYYQPWQRFEAAAFNARFAPVYAWAHNKGWFDEIYQAMLVEGLVLNAGRAVQWLDSNVIDGFVDSLAEGYGWVGGLLRRLQGGRVQGYAVGLFAGVVVLTALMLVFGSGGTFAAGR
jgi:NADH-quinone oxidoreductase subunit L